MKTPYNTITLLVSDAKELPFFDSILLNYFRYSATCADDRGLATGLTNVTNKEICNAFGVSERYVSLSISRLRKIGKIEFVSYDGKERILGIK
jgi:hypothetical protein